MNGSPDPGATAPTGFPISTGARAPEKDRSMNENENSDEQPGAFRTIITDEGVQRAAAGVVVALVVSGAKYLIFGSSK